MPRVGIDPSPRPGPWIRHAGTVEVGLTAGPSRRAVAAAGEPSSGADTLKFWAQVRADVRARLALRAGASHRVELRVSAFPIGVHEEDFRGDEVVASRRSIRLHALEIQGIGSVRDRSLTRTSRWISTLAPSTALTVCPSLARADSPA